jgi:endonuclease G
MKKLIFFFIVLPLISFSQLQNYEKYIPTSSTGDIYHYDFYSVALLEDHKLPEWTIYFSTKERITQYSPFSIKGLDLKKDPKVPTVVEDIHFYNNSYDKGHLVPAGDMSFDYDALKQSFYSANLTPMIDKLNRGVWKKAESLVRKWTVQYDSLIIISGCVFKDENYLLLPTGLAIPGFYYKIVIDIERMSAIGLVLPNSEVENSLISYVYSIDDIEKLIGIDFLYKLPESQQKLIEEKVNLEDWFDLHDEARKNQEIKTNNYKCNSKMAFIIGNADYYKNNEKLINPINDAILMYKTFKEIGFDTVIVHTDRNSAQMHQSVSEFNILSNNYDLNIFYYAGHGIQDVNSNSFLVPVDYDGSKKLDSISISLTKLIKQTSYNDSINSIVIIDACRSTLRSITQRPQAIVEPINLKLGLSTSYGHIAFDHPELPNTLYTAELSKALKTRNITVSVIFDTVWNKVFNANHQKQSPTVYYGQRLENLILFPD